jgi:hypothetical protein
MNNITDIIGGDLTSLLKNAVTNKFVNPNNSTFYPGKIVNNKDPKKLGRCQIRVYGVYDDAIPDEDLPWAIPDFTFTGSTLGSFIVPTVDSIVNVYLDNGDLYTPKYTTKVLQKDSLSNMSSTYDKDYPNTMVFFETDNGDYFKINRKTLEAEFRHASGLIITIDQNGNVNFDNSVTEDGNVNISVNGNVQISAKDDVKVSTLEGDIYLQSGTGDSALWQPNILPNCMFTGAPHGGEAAGVTHLRGGPAK